MNEAHGGRMLSWRALIWTGIAAVLVAPLVAMPFTDEVRWTGFDFAVAAILLVGAMVAYELAARFITGRTSRALIGGGLALLVLLIWAEGAVGIL